MQNDIRRCMGVLIFDSVKDIEINQFSSQNFREYLFLISLIAIYKTESSVLISCQNCYIKSATNGRSNITA